MTRINSMRAIVDRFIAALSCEARLAIDALICVQAGWYALARLMARILSKFARIHRLLTLVSLESQLALAPAAAAMLQAGESVLNHALCGQH